MGAFGKAFAGTGERHRQDQYVRPLRQEPGPRLGILQPAGLHARPLRVYDQDLARGQDAQGLPDRPTVGRMTHDREGLEVREQP